MKVTIQRDQLMAALCTAAKSDIRYYLNGVYLEATNMETRLTSTDGHTISLQRADAKDENEVDGVLRMILPRDLCERVKKNKMLPVVWIDNDDDSNEWMLTDIGTRISFKPVEGKFPDYRRIIPSQTSGEAARFNPLLIGQFVKAAVILGAGKKDYPDVRIAHNGTDSALVSIGRSDYLGVLAPLRVLDSNAPITSPHDWALAELAAPAPAEELV
jgi:DNA polymerase III subunit beta